MALFIVIIFGMSSIAFVFLSNTGTTEEQQQQTMLTDFVVEGDVTEALEFQYTRNGYTFLRFYHVENDPLTEIVEQIPDTYLTNINQKQVFVLKIPANETYIKITNLNTEQEYYNVSNEQIFDIMCETLIVTPSECGLRNVLTNMTGTA